MKAIIISLFVLMSSGGSCDSIAPYKYVDNSRFIIKGKLLNTDMTPLQTQTANLKSFNREERIVVGQCISNENGDLFISVPKGNNHFYLEFENKEIVYTTNHSNLIHKNPYELDWLGFFSYSYYDFSLIVLKTKV